MDDFSFFDYLSPFSFLLIEFNCIFSISYKILTNYDYNFIFIMIVYSVGTSFFFRASSTSFHPHGSVLLRLFLYLIPFLLFPCASVWENTRS